MPAARKSAESITISQARDNILAAAPRPFAAERVPLSESVGRVTVQHVCAAYPLPTYTNSAMDGYAFRYSDAANRENVTLDIAGQSFAGLPCRQKDFTEGQCIEIATGAAVPEAFDTVIPFEKCNIDEAAHTIEFSPSDVKCGANIRYEGEQIRAGQTIVAAGTKLTPQHIALLAAAGISEVDIFARVRVAIITTGSELVEPGQPLERFQTYNSNGVMLRAMLKSIGCDVHSSGVLHDSPEEIAEQIACALAESDMLILTGGAGNGKFDISQSQLGSMGTMQPWSINMRPGRPMRFGVIEGKPVFVLPGNPVAAFVTFLEFVRGALLRMQGLNERLWLTETTALLACDIKKKAGRAEFMRAKIVGYDKGVPVVEPLKNQSSADLVMLTQADVILCLDHAGDRFSKGDAVRIQSLHEALI